MNLDIAQQGMALQMKSTNAASQRSIELKHRAEPLIILEYLTRLTAEAMNAGRWARPLCIQRAMDTAKRV